MRADLTKADLAALEHQFPGLAARVAAGAELDVGGEADGVQSPHPASAVDEQTDGLQPLHPAPGTGCNERTGGVQPAQSRGATVAPEPSLEPSREPSAAARGCEALPAAADGAVSSGQAGEFFDALGAAWRLTTAQRARLTPAVLAALDEAGHRMAWPGITEANINSIRNPYAVLAARLSTAELPPLPCQRPPRPPWRG